MLCDGFAGRPPSRLASQTTIAATQAKSRARCRTGKSSGVGIFESPGRPDTRDRALEREDCDHTGAGECHE